MSDLQKKVSIYRLCSSCNKDFELTMSRGGCNDSSEIINNFQNCPHCGDRSDSWIRVVETDALKAQQSTIKELEEKVKGLEGAYSNINKDYQEILYQVQSKVPDQTRHERAVSIIKAHENQENPPASIQLDE